YGTGPGEPPTDPTIGPAQTAPSLPATIFGEGIAVGSFSVGTAVNNQNLPVITQLTQGDIGIFSDRLLSSVNRSVTTDFAAPALDVPTFRRRLIVVAATGGGTNAGGGTGTVTVGAGQSADPTDHNTFVQGGTSLSAAIAGGSFALVSSALDYWSGLASNGAT